MRTMKKLIAIAALMLGVLVLEPLSPAIAHGTCTSNADVWFSGGLVGFQGGLGCSENHPAGYSLSVDLRRRLPGGSWQIPPTGSWHIHTTCTQGGKSCATPAGFNTYNCRYDWKAFTTASVVGGHSIPSNTEVKNHTC